MHLPNWFFKHFNRTNVTFEKKHEVKKYCLVDTLESKFRSKTSNFFNTFLLSDEIKA